MMTTKNTEKAYVCITVSYKGDFNNGIAIYKVIKITPEDLKRSKEVVYSDHRPSKDHCIKIFSDSYGMIYGRLNQKVRSIVDNCECMISSKCSRGNYDLRAKLHNAYCKAHDDILNSAEDQKNGINRIKYLNEVYDL